MFKTGAIKVKTQILETIFAELPQTAKKVKLSIRFDEQEKLNTFKRLEAEREEDNEECLSMQSDSASEDQSALNQNASQKDANMTELDLSIAKKQVPTKLRYQRIEIRLEQGIIYKQFYEKEFDKIGEANCVKIKIRAQKITFEGYEIDDIEDAMDDTRNLMDKIQVEYIPRYGLEMNESAMVSKMLENMGIKIFRILDKYYRWYEVDITLSQEQQKSKKNKIKNLLHQIDSANHCLQYLSSIEKDIDRYKGSLSNDFEKLRYKHMQYRPLLQSLKGQIFQKEFKSKLNAESETEEQIEVELGISKDALVFHSPVMEWLEMSIKDVKTMFQSYDYFFLTIDSDHPIEAAIKTLKEYEYDTVIQKSQVKPAKGEIQEVKEINYIHFMTNYEKVKAKIQSKLNDPAYCGDYIPKQSVVFCIGFRRKVQEKKMEYLCDILEKLQQIWVSASYKISILLDQPEEIQQASFSYEFNQNQRIFSLTANETSFKTNSTILREYVINNKIEAKRIRQPNLDPEENNVSLSTVNNSQIINQTTDFSQQSMSKDINMSGILSGLNTNGLLGLANNQANQPDERCLKMLEDYKIFIPETSKEYNEKYKESTVKQNTIVKTDKRNRTIEDDLAKITDCNFQVFKIQLNPKHKIESHYQDPAKDSIVTVLLSTKISPFIKPKETGLKLEQGMNESFPVRLLTKSKETISENGYLLNIKKKSIHVDGKSFKIKYGEEFEVAKELICLKK